VRVSDKDGGRRAAISKVQLKHWVDYGNFVYGSSGIRFHDETSDEMFEWKSTRLNNYAGNTDPDWRESHLEATRLPSEHPGKLTLIFRHGPGPNPTYAGFSAATANFVVMPGFDATVILREAEYRALRA